MNLLQKNKWNNSDPTKRQGAWTSNFYDKKNNVTIYGLDDGVCAGLTCCYLIAGRQWTSFTNYIGSEGGKSVVRGVHNLQNQISANKSNREYYGNLKFLDIHKIILKEHGITYVKGGKIPSKNSYNSLYKDVVSNLNTRVGYLFHIYGRDGGHALALRVGQDTIHFFDPNFGEFVLPYRKAHGDAMARFIELFLCKLYSTFNELQVHCFNVI